MKKIKFFWLILVFYACASKQERFYLRSPIPKGATIAVLIEGENDVKNAVLTEFLKAGYNVKAINASDFYRIEDVFEVKDLKKISLATPVQDKAQTEFVVKIVEKNFDNLYKLHLYNFEVSKAEILKELRNRYKIDYVLLLAMKEWDTKYSWARAIQLENFDLIYVHNYPAKRKDSIQTIANRFIDIIQGKPN